MGRSKVDFRGVIPSKEQPPAPQAPALEQPAPATVNPRKGRGRVKPVSVGLHESELEELQRIADEHSVARNAVMAYFVRRALADYRAGRLSLKDSLKPRRSNTLAMPE